jgi:hypothetical protein
MGHPAAFPFWEKLVCALPTAARKPSAERKTSYLFAYPAMNRWAFFCRPARRDFVSDSPRLFASQESLQPTFASFR